MLVPAHRYGARHASFLANFASLLSFQGAKKEKSGNFYILKATAF
jgi:hypothetical protein